MKSIGVVDYGSGNLRSVSKALEAAGASVSLVTRDSQPRCVGCGRGARRGLFRRLRAKPAGVRVVGAADRDWLKAGRPYLGICLGYQLLFESSEETPGEKGLGDSGRAAWSAFPPAHLKIPHMGWNTLDHERGPLLRPRSRPSFYFVHSVFSRTGGCRDRQRALRLRRKLRRQREHGFAARGAISPLRKARPACRLASRSLNFLGHPRLGHPFASLCSAPLPLT